MKRKKINKKEEKRIKPRKQDPFLFVDKMRKNKKPHNRIEILFV